MRAQADRAWRIAAIVSMVILPTVAARARADVRAGGACHDEPILLRTGTGTLAGTFCRPDGDGPWAVALLVPGAGAVDRNGNSPTQLERTDTYRQLANGLAARGIATVRYDKRGVGESRNAAPSDSTLFFVAFARDAAEWVQWLQVDPRFSSVTVIGHGEGALVGMLAARVADADGFVSLAGHGRRGADVMREQFTPHLPIDLRADFRRALEALAEGRMAENVPYELASLLRPSAQAYLVSWFRFDPPTELARLTVPVLIVQGSLDEQATVRDAQLLNAGQPRADAIVIEGVDHALRKTSASSLSSATRAGARAAARSRDPVCEDVLEGVAAFVSQVRRR